MKPTLQAAAYACALLLAACSGEFPRPPRTADQVDALPPPPPFPARDMPVSPPPPRDASVEEDASPGPDDDDYCAEGEFLPDIEELCDWQAPDQPQCPEGYRCQVITNTEPDAVAVCVAPDCVDVDRDGYGVGDACAGRDCNDCDVTVNAGAAETCNGVDDNCNGVIDDAVDPQQSPIDCPELGVCADSMLECRAGEWRCDHPPEYEAVETLCDNLDNDCNGRVDDIDGLGEACTAGVGACEQPGVWRCDGVSGMRECSARPLDPVAERCNGIDDDCNGTVDDVPGAMSDCTLRAGSCVTHGTNVCDPVAGRLVCNAPEPVASPEICDGRDNDCDGRVDEEDPNTGEPCPVGPPDEICNGRDDDADNTIDEDSDVPCEGRCGEGVQRCVAGRLEACDAPDGGAEICNDRDDDCDGDVDEGLPQNACGDCGELQVICGDGRDDDCDGDVDEACPACAGEPDGTVVDEGVFGPCEGFAGECGEDGTQRRVQVVCRGGQPRDQPDEQACRRATGGQACVPRDGDVGRCERGACVCQPQQGEWSCENASTRRRDDGCGNIERDPCGAGEDCVRGQCACRSRDTQQCSGGDLYWFNACGGREEVAERCPNGCENNECVICRANDDRRCSGRDLYWYDSCGVRGGIAERCDHGCDRDACVICDDRVDQRCFNGDLHWYDSCDERTGLAEACQVDEVCRNDRCESCCEMDSGPRVGSFTPDYDAELCDGIGGGHIFRLAVSDISYQQRNGAMIALADIQVHKIDDTGPSTDITVWVVTAGDGRMACRHRHAYDNRRDLDNRTIAVTWRRGLQTLTIRDVPIWPNGQCATLAPGDRHKELGIITDDGDHRGQRVWMARETLQFDMSPCR